MTPTELATRLRKAHPELQGYGDNEIVEGVLKRRPELREQLSFDNPEPEEPAGPDPTLEGVVSDLPGGGWYQKDAERGSSAAGALASRTDPALGAFKALGSDALGLLQAAARHIPVTGEAISEGLQSQRDKLAPQSRGEEVGKNVTHVAEFFAPGPGGKTRAGKMLSDALQGLVIGSAQKGEINPEAAISSAGAGVVGREVAAPIAAHLGTRLPKSAIDKLTLLLKPKGGFQQEQVARNMEQMLEEGGLVGGNEHIVQKLTERSARLKGPRDAYRAQAADELIPAEEMAEGIIAKADELRAVAPDGTPFYKDKPQYDLLMKQANEVLAAGGGKKVPGSFYPPRPAQQFPPGDARMGDIEDILQAQAGRAGNYEKFNPSDVPAEEGLTALRKALNDANPGRAKLMGEYSDSLAAEQAGKKALSTLREPSHAGEQFATRAALSAAIGGPVGLVPAGLAEAAVKLQRFTQGAYYKSLSATARYNLGKQLAAAEPELAPFIRGLFGKEGSDAHEEGSGLDGVKRLLTSLRLKTPEAPQ